MAPRKTQNTDFNFTNVAVAPAEMPKRVKQSTAPNPLLDAVRNSLETSTALAMTIPADEVKNAENFLRRASTELGCGMSTQKTDHGNGTVTVHFLAKPERATKSYTNAEVRAWATAEGYDPDALKGRMPVEVFDAYRAAHGMKAIPRKA